MTKTLTKPKSMTCPACKGKKQVVQEEADQGISRGGIMDHVIDCPSCSYQTNMIGDMTRHRLARHPKKKQPLWSSRPS